MLAKPYLVLAVVLALLGTHATAYLRGYKAGAISEAARWQAQALKEAERAAQEREALQRAIREREIQWATKQQEGADAVAQVRVEYLPGKTIVKREVVRDVVFRECRVSVGMRDTINSALAGRPVPGAAEVGADNGRLPADA